MVTRDEIAWTEYFVKRISSRIMTIHASHTTSDEYGRGADSVRAEDTCMSDAQQGGHHDN